MLSFKKKARSKQKDSAISIPTLSGAQAGIVKAYFPAVHKRMSEIQSPTSKKEFKTSMELRGSKGSDKDSIRDRSRSGSQSKKPFMVNELRSGLANTGQSSPLKNMLANKSVSPTSSQAFASTLQPRTLISLKDPKTVFQDSLGGVAFQERMTKSKLEQAMKSPKYSDVDNLL